MSNFDSSTLRADLDYEDLKAHAEALAAVLYLMICEFDRTDDADDLPSAFMHGRAALAAYRKEHPKS